MQQSLCRLILFFALFVGQVAWAQGVAKLTGVDSSCKSQPTSLLSVWSYPRLGEPVTERPEIALHLASLIACSTSLKQEQFRITSFLKKGVDSGQSVYQVVEQLLVELKDSSFFETSDRIVFGIVSEFYDNLSIFLFEFKKGSDPKYIKITTKIENWSQSLQRLRPQFETSEGSLLDSLDRNNQEKTVSISFYQNNPDSSITKLNSEIQATLNSRFRNPLQPKLWDRRSFFRLSTATEIPDAYVNVHMEMSGTQIYGKISVAQNTQNARSLWVEGSLANLPEFEDKIYGSIRDMLSDVLKIYDYSVNLGPEFYLGQNQKGSVFSASIRHNRGDLAATLRLQIGRLTWTESCQPKPLFFGLSVLPGWQFYQSERSSIDAGVLIGTGTMDASFKTGTKEQSCSSAPITKTYIQATGGAFIQANYTSAARFSVLARMSYELSALAVINSSDSNKSVQRQMGLLVFLGLGLAL